MPWQGKAGLALSAFEAAGNGVAVTDLKGDLLWCNSAFVSSTGYLAEELRRQNMRLLRSDCHDAQFFSRLWSTVMRGNVWQGEIVNRRKDGSHLTLEQTITPVRNPRGQLSHFIAIQQDIAARKAMELALRESEQRFRSLSEATLEGIIIHEQGRILEANRAVEKMFGYGGRELIGRSLLALSQDNLSALLHAAPGGGCSPAYEFTGRRKDGVRIELEARNSSMLYRGRSVSVMALNDITQPKRDREQILLLERQRAVEVERSRFARDIHDELGANLTRIKLLSERLNSEVNEPEKVKAYAQLISSSSRELAESMDEIVWAINPHLDQLEHLGSYLMSYASQFLELANMRVRFDFPRVFPELRVSSQIRHSLFLAVKEALNNSVKHSHATEVILSLQVHGGLLELAVVDNGCGIARDELERQSPGGLQNLEFRLASVGGNCGIESQPGAGTQVRMSILCSTLPEKSWPPAGWSSKPDFRPPPIPVAASLHHVPDPG